MSDEPNKDEPIEEKDELKDELAKKLEAAQAEADLTQENEAEKKTAESQVDELKDALARCMADMQNFKRRTEEDKIKWIKFANYELLKTLLPIIDNFDRACQQVPENLKEDSWAKGVVQTHDELMKALDRVGVKRIEAVGKRLDPNVHEAVMQSEGEKDMILEEFEPGYTYHDQTLKAAKVKVGSGE